MFRTMAGRYPAYSNTLAMVVIGKSDYAPIKVLVELSYDDAPEVRRAVAGNPRTPATILAKLAQDRCKEVQDAVAGNRSTPAGLLLLLAQERDGVAHGSDKTSGSPTG